MSQNYKAIVFANVEGKNKRAASFIVNAETYPTALAEVAEVLADLPSADHDLITRVQVQGMGASEIKFNFSAPTPRKKGKK